VKGPQPVTRNVVQTDWSKWHDKFCGSEQLTVPYRHLHHTSPTNHMIIFLGANVISGYELPPPPPKTVHISLSFLFLISWSFLAIILLFNKILNLDTLFYTLVPLTIKTVMYSYIYIYIYVCVCYYWNCFSVYTYPFMQPQFSIHRLVYRYMDLWRWHINKSVINVDIFPFV
jgi:hypothetical protein